MAPRKFHREERKKRSLRVSAATDPFAVKKETKKTAKKCRRVKHRLTQETVDEAFQSLHSSSMLYLSRDSEANSCSSDIADGHSDEPKGGSALLEASKVPVPVPHPQVPVPHPQVSMKELVRRTSETVITSKLSSS